MSTPARFRAGLVGAGYVSQFHLAALRRLPQVEIIGLCDLDHVRARQTAEQHGTRAFATLGELIGAGANVIHVLTPPSSHAAVTLEAIQHGCQVLVEKPLATSVEDCEQIVRAARAAGVHVCVNHSLLFDPWIARALAIAHSGAIGEITAADYFRNSDYPPYRGGPLPPQYRDGGYPFRDLGVHALYLIRAFLGDIENVTAEFCSSDLPGRDPHLHFDQWRALVRAQRGIGQVHLAWNVRPLQHLLLVQGTRGSLRVDPFSLFLTRRRDSRLPKAVERVTNAIGESVSAAAQVSLGAARFALGKIVPYQGLHELVRRFYEALASGQPMPVNLEEATRVVHWTEQVARAADAAKERSQPADRRSSQPCVVVTGASGHLGRALVRRLLADGERVRLLVRRPPPPALRDNPLVEFVRGDLGDPGAVEAALAGATLVYHLGAAMSGDWAAHECATLTGTRNVVTACLQHRVAKLVHVSSLSVLDWAGHPPGQPVTESAPLEPRPHERGFYTRAKLEAEQIVRRAVAKQKLPAVIVRPGQIWSATAALLTPAVALRAGRLLLLLGDGEARLPLVHVEDVVDGLLRAGHSPLREGEIFHFVDEDLPTREEVARVCAGASNPPLRLVRVPGWLSWCGAVGIQLIAAVLRRPAPLSPYRLRSAVAPLRFDCSRARQQLGWEPKGRTGATLRAQAGPW